MSVDLITDAPLQQVIDLHRKHNSTVTIMLKHISTTQKTQSKSDSMTLVNYVGLDGNRIQFFCSSAELDSVIKLSSSYAKRFLKLNQYL